MADHARDVRRILAEHGCALVRHGKGDHDIWFSPITTKRFPVDGTIKSRHTANGIKKQAGIGHRFQSSGGFAVLLHRQDMST